MKKPATLTMITLLGAAVIGCDAEEPEPGTTPAAEQDRIPMSDELTPTPGEGQPVTIGVDSLAGAGPYITDGEGRALYAIENAPEGESTCYDDCAREWPPFLASGGQPRADAAPVQADLLGTLERGNGETQVTYDGRALYYYHDDQGPGQAAGQDVTDQWGEWYLVRPDGELLEEHGSGEHGRGEA